MWRINKGIYDLFEFYALRHRVMRADRGTAGLTYVSEYISINLCSWKKGVCYPNLIKHNVRFVIQPQYIIHIIF